MNGSKKNDKYSDLYNLYVLARAYHQQDQADAIETFFRKHRLIEEKREPAEEQQSVPTGEQKDSVEV